MQVSKGDIVSHWDGSVYVVKARDGQRTIIRPIVECDINVAHLTEMYYINSSFDETFKVERHAGD